VDEVENICYSGGSKGADVTFGDCAAARGDRVVHYSFAGHDVCPPEHRRILSELELHEADPQLKRANRMLRRRYPTRAPYVNNLLRRNWYQVRNTDRVYAVSYLDERGLVKSGTGWAVTMAALNGVKEIYLFDQDVGEWYYLVSVDEQDRSMVWEMLEEPPPKPLGRYTGIGSHDITFRGIEKIRALYA